MVLKLFTSFIAKLVVNSATFDFTFLMDWMTEVLAPGTLYMYIELEGFVDGNYWVEILYTFIKPTQEQLKKKAIIGV